MLKIAMADRPTIETDLIKINEKKAEVIASRIISKLKSKKHTIKTMTFYNDLAFAQHELIAKQLKTKTYFTRPFTSQDKGKVENRIGVIIRFFPKGTDMTKVHWSTIKSVERKLNNRILEHPKFISIDAVIKLRDEIF